MPMPHQYFWGSGMWIFPAIWILIGVALLIIIFLVLGRGYRGACGHEGSTGDSALDILKKRYARGDISKEDFERMRKDISS